MAKVNLIGISGKKRSGKNTTASFITEILAENGGTKFEEKSFAGKLKLCASIITGIPLDGFESEQDKETQLDAIWNTYNQLGLKVPMTRRNFLKKFGTDACTKKLHENTWVNALFMDYKPTEKSIFEEAYPNWIITDVRFPDEVEAIKRRGGQVIRIKRPWNDNSGDQHLSETALDNYNGFDFHIINDGTPDQLKEKVKMILFKLKLI